MATSQTNQPRRTLLLTGASRGIGHATVKRFSAAGWRVITCSRHPFPENCPWEAGPEDHIQVDLADADNTLEAIAEIKRRLDERRAARARQQRRDLAEGRRRQAALNDRHQHRRLAPRVPGEFLRADHAGARAAGRAQGRQGLGGQRHLDRRLARASVCRRRLLRRRRRRSRHSPAKWRATSDRSASVSTPSRRARSTPRSCHPAPKRSSQQIPLHRLGTPDEVAKIIYVLCTDTSLLRERRRDPHQRRPARVMTGARADPIGRCCERLSGPSLQPLLPLEDTGTAARRRAASRAERSDSRRSSRAPACA